MLEYIRIDPSNVDTYLGTWRHMMLDGGGQAWMDRETTGLALVVCVFDEHTPMPPSILPGLVVPMQWSKTPPRRPLPAGLRRVADRAKQTVDLLLKDQDLTPWHLRWLPELESHPLTIDDMNTLIDDWSSGYLSILGALYMAALHVPSRPFEVFASACQGKALAPVNHVTTKYEIIRRWLGMDTSFKMYVPVGSNLTGEDVRNIHLLEQGVSTGDLHRIITPYLSTTGCVPDPRTSSLNDQCDYANLPFMRTATRSRRTYHLNHLVEPLARRLHDQLPEHLKRPSHLYLCQSRGTGPVVLVIKAFAPKKVVVFYTPETHDDAMETRSRCESETVVDLQQWPDARVHQHIQGERVVVDVTGGTAAMTSLLTMAARKHGASITYLAHGYDDRGIVYGKESLGMLELDEEA